jgi:hypothetical protein
MTVIPKFRTSGCPLASWLSLFRNLPLLFLLACAPQTEYDRQDRLNRAQDEFAMREEACNRAGGFMVIPRYGSPRFEPDARELEMATCGRL